MNMNVTGAGDSFVNGEYVEQSGLKNGKPWYFNGTEDLYLEYSGTRWEFTAEGTVFYYSNDALSTNTPDRVVMWVTDVGKLPTPTVERVGGKVKMTVVFLPKRKK